jgi:hypothetical protein
MCEVALIKVQHTLNNIMLDYIHKSVNINYTYRVVESYL